MRFVFGAGAVAAVSVLTVGLVKPDFGGSTDQPTDQPVDATSDPNLGVASVADPTGQRTRARHVTEYVYLQPGEKAPKGATVISADRLTGQTNRGAPPTAATTDPTRRPGAVAQPTGQPTRQPTSQPTRQPAPQTSRPTAAQPKPKPPPPAATPAPTPRPTMKTRQSGRP